MSEHTTEDITLTTGEAAEFLKIKPGTLRKWRTKDIGPSFSRIGVGRGKIVYRKSVLVKYLEESEKASVVVQDDVKHAKG